MAQAAAPAVGWALAERIFLCPQLIHMANDDCVSFILTEVVLCSIPGYLPPNTHAIHIETLNKEMLSVSQCSSRDQNQSIPKWEEL